MVAFDQAGRNEELKVHGEANTVGPCMRCVPDSMLFTKFDDPVRLLDPTGKDRVGLENRIALAFDHHLQFGQRGGMQFASGDRNLRVSSQCA